MRKISVFFWVIVLAVIGAGSVAAKDYTWENVDRTVEPIHQAYGYLRVYTETEQAAGPAQTEIQGYHHLPYTIYTSDGRKLKSVDNHISNEDENPTLVDLAPGRYVVVPESHSTKPETVGVVIKDGEITEVHLKDA